MNLDEAIKHCEEVADTPCFTDEEAKCYSEHRQLAEWLKELKAYKVGESRSEIPNTCGDAISRQAVLDAFWKLDVKLSPTAIWTIQNMIKDVPSVTPEPCEDAISRRDVLNAITMAEVRWQAVDNVNKLPPVTPEQRTGRWCKVSMDKYIQHATYYYECSECGNQHIGQANYCPNCGARMEERENG